MGLDYLPGALGYTPALPPPPPELAAAVVWFDAFVTNVDRTARNPNILLWHKRLWLIDHGAALYFHHAWGDYRTRSRDPFPKIEQHTLLPYAGAWEDIDAALAARLTPDVINALVAFIPEDWLDEPAFASPDEHRAAYAAYLLGRNAAPRAFLGTMLAARARLGSFA